jgi:hypothetical protein
MRRAPREPGSVPDHRLAGLHPTCASWPASGISSSDRTTSPSGGRPVRSPSRLQGDRPGGRMRAGPTSGGMAWMGWSRVSRKIRGRRTGPSDQAACPRASPAE